MAEVMLLLRRRSFSGTTLLRLLLLLPSPTVPAASLRSKIPRRRLPLLARCRKSLTRVPGSLLLVLRGFEVPVPVPAVMPSLRRGEVRLGETLRAPGRILGRLELMLAGGALRLRVDGEALLGNTTPLVSAAKLRRPRRGLWCADMSIGLPGWEEDTLCGKLYIVCVCVCVCVCLYGEKEKERKRERERERYPLFFLPLYIFYLFSSAIKKTKKMYVVITSIHCLLGCDVTQCYIHGHSLRYCLLLLVK